MIRQRALKAVSIACTAALLFTGCAKAGAQEAPEGSGKENTGEVLEETDKENTVEDEIKESAEGNGEASDTLLENVNTEGSQMPSFTAKDLEGNTVTEAVFGEKDLTVVNVWGTFCPPCIGEMPELGEWAKDMPENVQLVGLIVDISGDEDTEHHDLAVEITKKAGAEFLQIIANSDFLELLRGVVGVPTTYFVDKEGNIVGDPIVGADVDGYKKFVEDYLNEW